MLDAIHVIRPASLVFTFGIPWLIIAVWYSCSKKMPSVILYFFVTLVLVEAILIGSRFLELALIDSLLTSFDLNRDGVTSASEKTSDYLAADTFKNAAHGRNITTLAFAIIAPFYVLIIGLCGKLFFFISSLD